MPRPEFTVEEKCRMFDDLYHIAEWVDQIFATSSYHKMLSFNPADPLREMMHILLGEENGW